jgi:hypothetical protein
MYVAQTPWGTWGKNNFMWPRITSNPHP